MACAWNATVASLQAALARDHYAVVPAAAMLELLSVQPEHAAGLWELWDEAVPQLDEDGQLPTAQGLADGGRPQSGHAGDAPVRRRDPRA